MDSIILYQFYPFTLEEYEKIQITFSSRAKLKGSDLSRCLSGSDKNAKHTSTSDAMPHPEVLCMLPLIWHQSNMGWGNVEFSSGRQTWPSTIYQPIKIQQNYNLIHQSSKASAFRIQIATVFECVLHPSYAVPFCSKLSAKRHELQEG